MKESSRLTGVLRGVSPCMDCPERFTACHDKCPKDARGEYGYFTWKNDVKNVIDKQKQHKEIEDEYVRRIKEV